MSAPEASLPPERAADDADGAQALAAARRQRNRILALGLLAFVVLVFAVTILRLQSNSAKRIEPPSAAFFAPG